MRGAYRPEAKGRVKFTRKSTVKLSILGVICQTTRFYSNCSQDRTVNFAGPFSLNLAGEILLIVGAGGAHGF
jgi:hypothetical protein